MGEMRATLIAGCQNGRARIFRGSGLKLIQFVIGPAAAVLSCALDFAPNCAPDGSGNSRGALPRDWNFFRAQRNRRKKKLSHAEFNLSEFSILRFFISSFYFCGKVLARN